MNLLTLLESSDVFGALDRRVLREIADRAQWMELRSGHVLFRQGEPGDAMYVVANGRLRVNQVQRDGSERMLAEVGRGQSLGELALITGEPRTSTAHAVRDTGLIGVSKELFDRLLKRHPGEMMQVARSIVSRLERAVAESYMEGRLTTRTIAVLPGHPGASIGAFAHRLATALGQESPTLKVDALRLEAALGTGYAGTAFDDAGANQYLVAWLNGLEARYHYLVYQANEQPDAWSRRCLRQADRIMVVVDADEKPGTTAQTRLLQEEGVRAPVELAVVHGDTPNPAADTQGWEKAVGAGARHHVYEHGRDMPRIARLITGRALGVVLAGGGARGFAHLGLFKALAERDIEVDLAGGASMGAFVAAMHAYGLDLDQMVETARDIFVSHNYLNDYTLPRISLISAGKFTRRLQALFGDTLIENLALPYFCVSTNLTRGASVLHEEGLLRTWVATSMAVPGFAPPIVYKGELLVDGGVSNNLPTEVMQQMGRGRVLASDVAPGEDLRMHGLGENGPEPLTSIKGGPKPPSIFKLLFRTATMPNELEQRTRASAADLYINMPVGSVGMFDWETMDRVVQVGYEHAARALDEYMSGESGEQKQAPEAAMSEVPPPAEAQG